MMSVRSFFFFFVNKKIVIFLKKEKKTNESKKGDKSITESVEMREIRDKEYIEKVKQNG